jgi:predicted RNase H-like HicB family nuclease
MERVVKIHVQKLPEGVYLATSEDVQGLIVQGRTVTKTLEIARDVARKLLEAQSPDGLEHENLVIANVQSEPSRGTVRPAL